MQKQFIIFLVTVLVIEVSSQCVRDPYSNCVIYNGTHVKTFDGKLYNLNSICGFTLVSIPSSNLVINYLKNPSGLEIIYKKRTFLITFNTDGSFVYTVDGLTQIVPSTLSAITVSQPGSMAIVEISPLKMKLRYNGDTVEIIQNNKNNFMITSGLCGNNDGCNDNELINSDGQPTTSVVQWADSWGLNGCLSHTFLSSCGTNIHLIERGQYNCTELFQRPQFADCLPYSNDFMPICISNYCACPNNWESCECEMLDAFVRTCEIKNNSIMDWRVNGLCEIQCNNTDQLYSSCAPYGRQLTCGDSLVSNPNPYDCEEGCYCPEGKVWYQGQCLYPSDCP